MLNAADMKGARNPRSEGALIDPENKGLLSGCSGSVFLMKSREDGEERSADVKGECRQHWLKECRDFFLFCWR